MIKKIHHYLYALLLCLTVTSATEPSILNANISSDGTGQTYISSATYKNKKVNYTIKDNLAIYEGDIILGTVDEAEGWREAKENTPTTNTALGSRKKWSKGIIPYRLDADVSSKTRTLIKQAMRDIQTKVNVSFVERTKNNAYLYLDYINIVSTQPACWSEVGRTGGIQEMNLIATCNLSGISHEFSHALGLFQHQTNKKSSITLLQELYGKAIIRKNTISLKKRNSTSRSVITSPIKYQKITVGKNFTLRWKNNGATSHTLYYYASDEKGTYHRISKEGVTGVTKTLNAPPVFKKIYLLLMSFKNGKILGYSTLVLLPKKDIITNKPSIITSPSLGTTISSRQNITLKWKSYGADRHDIFFGIGYHGRYSVYSIASHLSSTSKTIQMPTFFKYVDIILISYKNGKKLGSSNKIRLFPNKNAMGPTEIISPVRKNLLDLSFNPKDDLTIKWKNHGATKDFLYVSAVDREGYQTYFVFHESVTDSKSKKITIPSYAREIIIELDSYNGSKLLGTAKTRLYAK